MNGVGGPWRVEEACFNAFPALKQVLFGGWLMRFAAGLSRRANSVNPLGPACAGITAAIAASERLYRGQDLPTIFRLPSLVDPALDDELAARGYTREGETGVIYSPIDRLTAAADPAVRLLASPEAEWLAAMVRFQRHHPGQAVTYRRIVGAIALPARFALLAVGGAPAALAYGAVHDGLLCYESVITDPRHRRQGLARRVIASLAAWACDEGAVDACLQVDASNAAALALYRGFGLSDELYRYHYRRQAPRT